MKWWHLAGGAVLWILIKVGGISNGDMRMRGYDDESHGAFYDFFGGPENPNVLPSSSDPVLLSMLVGVVTRKKPYDGHEIAALAACLELNWCCIWGVKEPGRLCEATCDRLFLMSDKDSLWAEDSGEPVVISSGRPESVRESIFRWDPLLPFIWFGKVYWRVDFATGGVHRFSKWFCGIVEVTHFVSSSSHVDAVNFPVEVDQKYISHIFLFSDMVRVDDEGGANDDAIVVNVGVGIIDGIDGGIIDATVNGVEVVEVQPESMVEVLLEEKYVGLLPEVEGDDNTLIPFFYDHRRLSDHLLRGWSSMRSSFRLERKSAGRTYIYIIDEFEVSCVCCFGLVGEKEGDIVNQIIFVVESNAQAVHGWSGQWMASQADWKELVTWTCDVVQALAFQGRKLQSYKPQSLKGKRRNEQNWTQWVLMTASQLLHPGTACNMRILRRLLTPLMPIGQLKTFTTSPAPSMFDDDHAFMLFADVIYKQSERRFPSKYGILNTQKLYASISSLELLIFSCANTIWNRKGEEQAERSTSDERYSNNEQRFTYSVERPENWADRDVLAMFVKLVNRGENVDPRRAAAHMGDGERSRGLAVASHYSVELDVDKCAGLKAVLEVFDGDGDAVLENDWKVVVQFGIWIVGD
ncbi:hypothetical protein BDK51DRAFT_30359 [Blyttiomyces helicus]|uniref:Uncharacterized protein n=1 Tax=Blyttiomyces helicus TaxID=388810 RepID=A0A4V1ISC9_9FUNG|nr:hypothetical protein BDK51DRAFT_30359 [Blyttiomyces helicus]|eukprot:RKO93117.1 hypothetical protein BDK51DRAFT_30359 [Blyttiomyces helicus]